MIRRAQKLNVMSMDEYQYLIRTMQRRGLRKTEPLDDILFTASPALLKTSILILLQEKIFTPSDFMDELATNYGLSIGASEVEYLLDLPKGTLAIPKIIEFPSLYIKRPD